MNGTLFLHKVKNISLGKMNTNNSNARTLLISFENGSQFDLTMFGQTKEAVTLPIENKTTITINGREFAEVKKEEDEIPF